MRVRRSLLNFGTNALLMLVTMLVALPAGRWLLVWLGAPTLGGLKVVNQAFGYLTLLELGLGGALGPLLARAIGAGDDNALRETVAAGSRAYVWIVIVTLAIGLLLTPVVPWFAKEMTPSQISDLKRGWIVLLAAFVPLVLLPLRTVFEARQLGYVVNLLLLGQSLLITGCSLAFARAGWGITGQAAAQVVGVWSFSLALALGIFKTHPGLLGAMLTTPTTRETRRALRNLSAPTLVLNLSGRIGLLSDYLVLGALRNVGQVTSLEYTQKLAVMGQSILQAVGGASWAGMAELHAKGEHETFNRRVIEMTRMVSVLGVIGLVPVVAYNRAFFNIWVGDRSEYGGDLVVALAATNAVLFATQALWCWCFTATGKIRAVVPVSVAIAVVNLAASVAATRFVGLPGPLLGSTIAYLAIGLWTMPHLLKRAFGTPTGPLLKAFVVPFAVGMLAAGALWEFTQYHQPNGWVSLAAEMSLAALVMGIVGVFGLLTREDRDLWRLRIIAMRAAS